MARLPSIAGDNNRWGEVLNEFLRVAHHDDGTHRSMREVVNVRDYGAVGDGVTDDSDAIQQACNENAPDGATVYVPAGIYMLQKPLIIPSRCNLFGDGARTVLKALQNGWGEPNQAMVILQSIEDVIIRDLVIDQNGIGRTSGNAIRFSMLMTKATNCLVENVVFQNHGLSDSNPTGPVLEIIAKDAENDFEEGIIGGCSHNIIRRCRFVKPPELNLAFAIRVLTNWEKKRSFNDFIHLNEGNLIEECVFDGEYNWNMIEFAGGGTCKNKVLNCHFIGRTLSAIDFDKGASYNTAAFNTIVRSGKPDMHLNDSSTRMATINDHGNAADYLNVGNIVAHNIIDGVNNPSATDVYESGISIAYCKSSLIIGNRINMINESKVGRGILIDRECYDATVRDNSITNTAGGIATNANGSHYINLSITGNQIDCKEDVLSFGAQPDQNVGLLVQGNMLTTSSSAKINLIVTAAFDSPLLSANILNGGFECINTAASNTVMQSNILRNAAQNAIRVSAKSILIGNVAINSANSDLVVTPGTPPPVLIGNSFS